MKAVARAINWGIKKRYQKNNPLRGMEKPPRFPRVSFFARRLFRLHAEMVEHVLDKQSHMAVIIEPPRCRDRADVSGSHPSRQRLESCRCGEGGNRLPF